MNDDTRIIDSIRQGKYTFRKGTYCVINSNDYECYEWVRGWHIWRVTELYFDSMGRYSADLSWVTNLRHDDEKPEELTLQHKAIYTLMPVNFIQLLFVRSKLDMLLREIAHGDP